jgi:hypothetical protein
MTDEAVSISITIKVENGVMELQKRVPVDAVEETIQTITLGLGQQVLQEVIHELDDRIARNVPAGWRNVGTEMRWMVSSLGAVRYKRRIYQDEQGRRRKPIDDLFDLQPYMRMNGRVQEMGSALACNETYRLAAEQLSYLTKTPISHSALQRMVWSVGNRIADGEEAERRRIFDGGEPLEGGEDLSPRSVRRERWSVGASAAGSQAFHGSTGGYPEHGSKTGRKGPLSFGKQVLCDRRRAQFRSLAGTSPAGSPFGL